MHGLALNVNTNLHYFDYILPCGLPDKAVTSMEKELAGLQDMPTVKAILKNNLISLFGMELLAMEKV